MFDGPAPRLFGIPPGADFPRELLRGLEQRLDGQPPEAWAQAEIFVNTRRMQRRLIALFNAGPPRLIPRIRLVTALGEIPHATRALPPPVPPLRRRLELAQLVAGLLKQQPELAPRAATFDLADSLADLMDEMQGEGVSPNVLHDLDLSHLSAHWDRTRAFLRIVEPFFRDDALDAEARRRIAAESLLESWKTSPPSHPVIVAGSTGSRGATALFMNAVAHLPQGAVILPGFDFDQPADTWSALDDAMTAEDHPQYRFRRVMQMLDLEPDAVRPWRPGATAPSAPRNRLVSLALRPAPVTDQWMDEGPGLSGIADATADMTLIEAPSPRAEALTIALRLRQAAEQGLAAALVTPDRMLTRQVTAALDRWGIVPDDSAGQPLALSAPGRFLRHVSTLFGQKLTAEDLLILLKHPLTCSSALRGQHLLWTRELELYIRRNGAPYPTGADLRRWAGHSEDGRVAWAEWLGALLATPASAPTRALTDHVQAHVTLAEALAAGPAAEGTGKLWQEAAGEVARKAVNELLAEAAHGGVMSPSDYAELFRAILNRHEVHEPVQGHPGIMIWGTLEARVQGADLVILGGLNEGSWPDQPAPDPWLNRDMRHKSDLLLPERRIGLAAHDFQQAIAAREVVLTRAIRNDEAETVPSRWLNRLMNLLGGLHAQGGPAALNAMRRRGQNLLALGEALESQGIGTPVAAPRPAPCPPVAARPAGLSVTRIQTLIRDPYAIYGAYVLGLRKLDPLRQEPDAPLRGTVLHKVMEQFAQTPLEDDPATARARLMHVTDTILAQEAPWPAARRVWRARVARIADRFLADEAHRRARAEIIALECKGRAEPTDGFILSAKADRIDRQADGRLVIYDYKTGKPPSDTQMREYDKQLLLEAAIAERGGFEGLAPATVDHVAYIGLGNPPEFRATMLEDDLVNRTWAGLADLIEKYRRPLQGFTARRALFSRRDLSDYDHLSRYGEWDETVAPTLIEVGE